jgi:hypothetical protein
MVATTAGSAYDTPVPSVHGKTDFRFISGSLVYVHRAKYDVGIGVAAAAAGRIVIMPC